MPVKYELPSPEHRSRLLTVDFGADPQPPICSAHTNSQKNSRHCETCRVYFCWRTRMTKRFNRLGLAFTKDVSHYPPGPCPEGHRDVFVAGTAGCEPCRLLRNWRQRQYHHERKAGIRRVTDVAQVREHLQALRAGDMTAAEIARAASCGERTVEKILGNVSGRRYISATVARGILDIPVPEVRFDLAPTAGGSIRFRVSAVGVHRRIQAACCAGHPLAYQARRLGYTPKTVREWLAHDLVSTQAARAVRHLYPTLVANPGTDTSTTELAHRKGWLPARYFSPTNIDDPHYQPLRRINRPGVRRQLRALAWMAHGPEQIGREIGEPPLDVSAWTDGASYPAYIAHLVDALYDKLSGRFGPAYNIARRARKQNWASPAAWHDIDIHAPNARPQIVLDPGVNKSSYVLDSQIYLAIDGQIPAADLIHDEKVVVVRVLHRRNWSDRRIGVWLRWCDDPSTAATAVAHFRARNGIADRPTVNTGGSTAENDFIITAAA